MTDPIGWIGVGSIGHRMARHVAAAGHTLVVADAGDTERAPAGSIIAQSNGEVAERAATIVLSLPDGAVVERVAHEIAEARGARVRTVVDTSTIGIAASERTAAILGARGIRFVDAPVSGGIAGADKATLSVMMACPTDVYAELSPLLSLIGKPFHVGERPGQGQALKLLNNFLSATAMAATSEAIAFGVRQGLAMKTMLDVLNVSTGRNSATEDKFARRILHDRYDAGFTSTLQSKDVGLYLENARSAGVADDIAAVVAQVWAEMAAATSGADITRMYTFTCGGRGRDS
jgi:3-hydroxyisobutyrate dehydrogenase